MLEIKNLTKHYPGSEKGVSDLTLHVKAGDLYAFIGPNGAGKTTTLKAICGVHDFDEGEIFVDEIDIKKDALKAKSKLAYIPDNPDLFDYLTGIQYLNFVADVFEISAEEREKKIREYAEGFGITKSLGDLISTYSHGMKQKLAIISALIHEPKLLILDEPFVGLDPKAALTLKKLMRGLCGKGGAVFFSTHVLEVAEKLCNKVAIIKDGKLVAAGEMARVVKKGKSLESIFMELADE
ncbi:MAG: ABC transporter ATP-binding protein [Candidatus Saccharibacteria bacterium]|nr:ABC transporter ATP-binding protein [Candidatus Saccharibacteria bacterium]